jgi:hypothetical protein
MIPGISITKSDGNTGVARPSVVGILAIVASSDSGVENVPATYQRDTAVATDFGYGRLSTFASYTLGVTGNPIVAVKPTTATAATYGTLTQPVKVGTFTATVDGSVLPNNAWSPYFIFVAGGTIGVSGITYQYALDGGNAAGPTLSEVQALGTASTITIPNSGVKIDLGSGTVVAGDTIAVGLCSPAYPTSSDLIASMQALKETAQPWEGVLIDALYSAAIGAEVDAWLIALEQQGKFRMAWMNTRMRNAGETEAAYQTAIVAVLASTTSINLDVGADGGDSVDWNQGVDVPLPTSLAVAARALSQSVGTDPAQVSLGPITNFSIVDERNNPKYHNEENYPGLDVLKLSTLRSFNGYSEGAYITNARILSPGGSDYVYDQHVRVINLAASLAWARMTGLIGQGLTKSKKIGPNGERYVSEVSAQKFESAVNAAFFPQLTGQVQQIVFTLNRDDDISSNAGAVLTGQIQGVAVAYFKNGDVTAGFVKAITIPLSPS